MTTEGFNLDELRARRDAAIKLFERWILSAEDLIEAYKLGEREFSRANLDGATLDGATLYGANLSRANLSRANLSRANLDGATLYGANLDGATLDGATLDGANLDGANLYGAKSLINTRGIYSVYAPGMSSRNDYLLGGINERYELVLYAGCFAGSADKLRQQVVSTHGENGHARRYALAINCIEGMHQADAADGVWERMKERLAAETEAAAAQTGDQINVSE